MGFVGSRERLAPELVRSEVARGRMIIPANIHHTNLQPMCLGVSSNCKINSNIANSSVTSDSTDDLDKHEPSPKTVTTALLHLTTSLDSTPILNPHIHTS